MLRCNDDPNSCWSSDWIYLFLFSFFFFSFFLFLFFHVFILSFFYLFVSFFAVIIRQSAYFICATRQIAYYYHQVIYPYFLTRLVSTEEQVFRHIPKCAERRVWTPDPWFRKLEQWEISSPARFQCYYHVSRPVSWFRYQLHLCLWMYVDECLKLFSFRPASVCTRVCVSLCVCLPYVRH